MKKRDNDIGNDGENNVTIKKLRVLTTEKHQFETTIQIASKMNLFVKKFYGIDMKEDKEGAKQISIEYAQKGLYFSCGFCYSMGFGVKIDVNKAFIFFTLFIEESKEIKEYQEMVGYAENMIGFFYEKKLVGNGHSDRQKSVIYYERAIQKNCPISMNNMADKYGKLKKNICLNLKVLINDPKRIIFFQMF